MANWIAKATRNKGALRRELGVSKGNTISSSMLASAAKSGGKTGRRARLAITLGRLRKRRRR